MSATLIDPRAASKYQDSELGPVPAEWALCPVQQMGGVLTGKALASRAPGRQRPYLRTKNVFDGRIELDDVLSMPMTDAQFENFEVIAGDVLLNEGQSLELVGRCALYSGEYGERCAMQNQLIRFRARPGVSPEFAAHLFRFCQQSGIFARIALQTTSIAHLGTSRFARLALPWPPSDEQRAIAQALSDVDALIGGLDKLIAKKRAFRLTASQALLTGDIRLRGFTTGAGDRKHTEIGSIPYDWSIRRLGDEVEALEAGVSVRSAPESSVPQGSPSVLKTSACVNGHFRPLECKPILHTDLSRVKLFARADRILISRMNTPDLVGDSAYVDRDYPDLFLPDRLWMTRFSKSSQVCALWLSQLLSSSRYKRRIRDAATGTSGSMKNISKASILNMQILWPPPDEQRAIANAISDMDAEISGLELRRQKVRSLKHGMTQQLLTGRLRLIPLEVIA